MSRAIDKPSFTYSAFSAYASGLDVKCPKCHGHGVVTADRENSYFKCMNCFHSLVKEHASYRYCIHNQCSHCERHYRIDIKEPNQQRFPVLRAACPYCGTVMPGTVQKTKMTPAFYMSQMYLGCEPFFGLELWFLTSFQDKTVWAINREHLTYLIDYLSADLREKPQNSQMRTQADHLPTFMKTAKNRARMVKILKKLQEK